MTALLCSLFFASGLSALVFEMLWFREAGLAFGNSVWASSLVLSGFMAGLAVGNALAARYGELIRNPLRAYATAEAVIALTGVGLVYLFPVLGTVLAPWLGAMLDQVWILNPVRLVSAFLLLLIPSTAMGVTLPLLTKALTGYNPQFGLVLGRLYGWNTLGAVTGAVVGETYLIGAFGLRGTAFAAGALNLVAAAFAYWLSTRDTPRTQVPIVAEPYAPQPPALMRWSTAAFISGLCLLALEVVWFRFMVLFVEGYAVAFALMLGIVLAGIALGGLAAGAWLRFSPGAHRFASSMAFLAGLLCMASYAVFPRVIEPFAASTGLISNAWDILHIGVPLMFPVSFLSGVFFTLVGAGLRDNLASATKTVGILTLANTAGAALGSLLGGFILLPVLGMEKSFFAIAVCYGGVGLLLVARTPIARRIGFASAAVLVASLALFPFGLMEKHLIEIPVNRWLRLDATAKLAAVREGLTETIVYLESRFLEKPLSYRMLANSLSMSTTSFAARRYQKLYVYWPMAVHPGLKRALLIAFGVGNTAKAMTDTKSLESIDVVDVSRDILETNRIVYPDSAASPLHDPRVRVHIEDGRHFLQVTDQRFDLITGEPPPPHGAGIVNLYTREYFQLIYDRLAEGGIVTYWLPIDELSDVSSKAVLRAFCDVFENCSLWNGAGTNLMMVGLRNPRYAASEEQFTRQWEDPVVATEMKRLGLERPEQLGALFIGDAGYLKTLLADSQPLVDNYPKLIEAPTQSKQQARQLFNSFTDESAAMERFERSPLIRRLWPDRMMAASLPYFEFQGLINTHFYGFASDPYLFIAGVHRLLTQSSLSAPVLWRLGSDPDVQRIAANATTAELAQLALQYHLGARLIAERNYAAAVEPLRRSEELPKFREAAFRLRIFALCMSGQTEVAQRAVQERSAQIQDDVSLRPFWEWMKKNFGIDPLARARS